MTGLEEILGAIAISLASGVAGSIVKDRNSVKKPFCDQLRSSCQALLIEKIDNLGEKVDDLKKVVDSKLLSL